MDPKKLNDLAGRLAKGSKFPIFAFGAAAVGYGLLNSLYTGMTYCTYVAPVILGPTSTSGYTSNCSGELDTFLLKLGNFEKTE